MEKLVKEFKSLSVYRTRNRDHNERQRDLLESITSNPKPKTNSIFYYRGRDLTNLKNGKQRNEHRDYYLNMDLKINWQTVELVNVDERNLEEKPLHELSKKMREAKLNIHWLGKADDNGKDKYFLVSKDLIPDNYATKKGPVFSPNFFKNMKCNVEMKIPKTIRDKFKLAYKEYKNSALQAIKPYIDPETKKRAYYGKTVLGTLDRENITEQWLKENFQKYYPEFIRKLHNPSNLDKYCDVPVGSRDNAVEGLLKIESPMYISIYLPNSHKCAFANMANALYAIYDYGAARYIEDHMNTDINSLINLLNEKGSKHGMNHFTIAIRLLQEKFGYQITAVKTTDDLLKPLPEGHIKYVTLLPQRNGYKHVIAIARDKIYDCENKKVLELCRENIAWCGAQTVKDLLNVRQTIIIGYILRVSKKRAKKELKQRHSVMEEHKANDENEPNKKNKNLICRKKQNDIFMDFI